MTRASLDILRDKVAAAVDAEGLRPFARRADVGIGVVRSLLDSRDISFSNAASLAAAVKLDFGFGEVPQTKVIEADPDSEFVHLELQDVSLAAGAGFFNASEYEEGQLAFRREWLQKLSINPVNARLARVTGSSMHPTLADGDVILIDTSRRSPATRRPNGKACKPAPIYAVIDGGEARIKRVERPADDVLVLISDNILYPPEVKYLSGLDDIQIVGEVVWWGHTTTS